MAWRNPIILSMGDNKQPISMYNTCVILESDVCVPASLTIASHTFKHPIW